MTAFAHQVVRWQARHGRHHLPWQGSRDPYRVWLSEIMLQQTQVSTVLDYYPRFLRRFPDVTQLAAAALDEVLGLWSGLGYYSRARNLHRCAQQVVAHHGAQFPRDAATLASLPGIGRSTAAAIAAFCSDERVAILDGNVKRVLARALGYGADLSVAAHERVLWDHATALLPADAADMPGYTQGLMDLGSAVCTPRVPRCEDCPLSGLCVARREGDPGRYPVKTRKLRRTAQSLWLLVARNASDAVWLTQRPARGVWASLYCPPVFDSRDALLAALPARHHARLLDAEPFVHVLTHKDLHLHPVLLSVARNSEDPLMNGGAWHAADGWPRLGLPAPVRRLLAAA